MNLMDLKNFDIGAYIKGVIAASRDTKKLKSKSLIWVLLGIVVFVLYVYFIFFPYLAERSQINKMVSAIPEMEANIKYLEVANKKAHDDLVQTELSYLDLNRRFINEGELEDLYRKLSQMAASQGLIISSLSADGEDAVFAGGKTLAANQARPAPPPESASGAANPNPPPVPVNPLFYRVRIKLEMAGGYNRYMRYRKLLAEFEKVVNIDKEQISLVKGDVYGTVSVKSQLSVYRLPEKLQIKKTASSPQSQYVGHMGASHNPLERNSIFHDLKMRLSNFSWVLISSAHAADSPASTANTSPNGSRSNERDPFARSSNGMIEGGRDPRYSPLTMADPQTYVITGVMVSSHAKAAMIKTDLRESFVVKIGDRLGNQGATISDIDLEGVILRQPGGGKLRLYIQSQGGQYPLNDSSKGINGGAR